MSPMTGTGTPKPRSRPTAPAALVRYNTATERMAALEAELERARLERRAALLELRALGWTLEAISAAIGVHRTRVFQILKAG